MPPHAGRWLPAIGAGVRRRWPWLLAAAIGAGAVAVPAGVVLGWLFPAGVRAAAGFTAALWLALTAAAAALVLLVDQRPPRQVTLATLTAVVLLLVCVVPGGGFWTFAVSHAPTGENCPDCAVIAYLGASPLGGFAADSLAFHQAACGPRRDELEHQVAEMARDVDTAAAGADMAFSKAELGDSDTQVDGDRAVVTVNVGLRFLYPGRATSLRVDAGTWTFTTVNDDGWRVCQVDAPDLCEAVLNCELAPPGPTASPTPGATTDPLGHLRCGPLDPFRTSHNCPSSPAPTPS